jgi:rhodanese-related sulfurtransferase
MTTLTPDPTAATAELIESAADRTGVTAPDLSAASAGAEGARLAAAHFRAKLQFETDPSDVAAARLAGATTLVVVDSRGDAAWRQGRLPGAVHLPTARITAEAASVVPADADVVVYCWGPGCNGGTKAALAFAEAGYAVREMIGGFEYWAREGLPVETDAGLDQRTPDPLTAPSSLIVCDC